jgi:hypothetical protein
MRRADDPNAAFGLPDTSGNCRRMPAGLPPPTDARSACFNGAAVADAGGAAVLTDGTGSTDVNDARLDCERERTRFAMALKAADEVGAGIYMVAGCLREACGIGTSGTSVNAVGDAARPAVCISSGNAVGDAGGSSSPYSW